MANVKISELSAASTLDGTELLEVVQGGTNKKATSLQVITQFNYLQRGYKVFYAEVSQSGEDDPIVTAMPNNDLGSVSLVWASAGTIDINSTALFTSGKTLVSFCGSEPNNPDNEVRIFTVYYGNSSNISLRSFNTATTLLNGFKGFLKIEVFN